MPGDQQGRVADEGVRRRAPRSDGRRNREQILEVADAFFSESGIGASLDALAKRAGVGPGTLYRHFPTREALLAALLRARDEELEHRREVIERDAPDSGAMLASWLEALGEWLTAFEGLPDPLRVALTDDASPLALTCHGLVTTTDRYLEAAQRDGLADPAVRGRELFLGVLATAWVSSAALADGLSRPAFSTMLRQGWAARDN